MIVYKGMPKTVLEFDRFICDKCKKEVTNDIELQETFSGKFVGGYTSVFGDMAEVEFDLSVLAFRP